MKLSILICIVVAVSAAPVVAQSVAPITTPIPTARSTILRAVTKAKTDRLNRAAGIGRPFVPKAIVLVPFPPYSRIHLVLDVSGSMTPVRVDEACRVVDAFGGDGFQVAATTFQGNAVRWPGVPDACAHRSRCRCVKVGWARVPKDRLVLGRHLDALPKGGMTRPAAALGDAVRDAPRGTLVVFVSDGEFNAGVEPTLKRLTTEFALRRRQGKRRTRILVWSVTETPTDSMRTLAKVGRAGLWVRADRSGPW